MKPPFLSFALFAVLIFALPGCGKSGSTSVDAAQIEKSFATAEDAVKATATKAVNAMRSAEHNVAVAELLKLAADPKLTDQQKRIVAEALDQLKNAAVDAGNQAAGEAGKALGDAQKTLGK